MPIKDSIKTIKFHQVSVQTRVKAKIIDDKINSGLSLGKLAGIVCAVKDNIAIENHSLTAGSKILDGYISPFSATVIQRLIDENIIIIGRTNMDAFGMGLANEYSYYGVAKMRGIKVVFRVGSSGSSAVAVALDMADFALGSDTGGSVRQPAAYNKSKIIK